MGILNVFKKNSLDVSGTIKDVTQRLDDRKFTDEERSTANFKLLEMNVEYLKTQIDENSVRSRARRMISYFILGSVFATFCLCVALRLFGKIEEALYIKNLAIEFKFVEGFIAVIIFFFGNYLIHKSIKSIKKKE